MKTAQTDRLATRILAAYGSPFDAACVVYLGGAGGFSGARFWRVITSQGTYCLRRWPKGHPLPERLQFIHSVLRHVEQKGFRTVPVPCRTGRGETFVQAGGHLWELTPWLAGDSDFHRTPSDAKLRAALAALARFHRAAATHRRPSPKRAPSPAVANRLAEIERWLQGDLHRLQRRIVRSTMPELADRVGRLVALFPHVAGGVRQQLEGVVTDEVPLQPCLRDVWSDHVLFRGEQVSGLIDFGAMREESPAADIARLLGSMAGDRWDQWQIGLTAYQEVRPLEAAEQRLVEVLDASIALLSGMNWARWIYLDDRHFDDYPTILERVSGFLDRVERLAQSGQSAMPIAAR